MNELVFTSADVAPAAEAPPLDDPDRWQPLLPMPYRMIDDLLTETLDQVMFQAYMKAQAKAYPMKTCVVATKNALGDSPKQMVIGGRLVQTCCGGCAKKVKADPAKYVAMVDAAWSKAGGKGKTKMKARDDADVTAKKKKTDADG